jgi:hypothetical protein
VLRFVPISAKGNPLIVVDLLDMRCHEYQRALADITTAERAMRADAEQDDVADVISGPQTRTRRQS